jgi:hydroxyacylglutathione hydrolase
MTKSSYKVHRIPLVNVSAFLIYRPGEAILVDSGNGGSEQKIFDAIWELGLELNMLKLVILTHAHFDHAGSAGKLKELTGCKVLSHNSEIGRLKDGYAPLPPGTRWKAKLLVSLARTFRSSMGKFPPVEPDLVVQDTFDLKEFGFPGKVIHSPGHTH